MKNFTYILFIVLLMAMASCSTDSEAILETASVERIDIVLDGTEKEYIYLEQDNFQGLSDLVQYDLTNGTNQVDFKIKIDDQRTLIFKVFNDLTDELWAYVQDYSTFPAQNLEDKTYYVKAELHGGGETAAFKSHIPGVYPQGITLNTFRVESYDPETQEVLCRIVGLPMLATSSSNEELVITGTFRGFVNM